MSAILRALRLRSPSGVLRVVSPTSAMATETGLGCSEANHPARRPAGLQDEIRLQDWREERERKNPRRRTDSAADEVEQLRLRPIVADTHHNTLISQGKAAPRAYFESTEKIKLREERRRGRAWPAGVVGKVRSQSGLEGKDPDEYFNRHCQGPRERLHESTHAGGERCQLAAIAAARSAGEHRATRVLQIRFSAAALRASPATGSARSAKCSRRNRPPGSRGQKQCQTHNDGAARYTRAMIRPQHPWAINKPRTGSGAKDKFVGPRSS